MNSSHEIREYWKDLLVPVPDTGFQDFTIPTHIQVFLQDVGLPEDERLNRYLKLGLRFTPQRIRSIEFGNTMYLVVGSIVPIHDYLEPFDEYICLREVTGEVFVLEPQAQFTPALQLMNEGPQHLLLCLKRCLQYTPRLIELAHQIDNLVQDRQVEEGRQPDYDPQKEYDQMVAILRKDLAEIDPLALARSDYYWPSVLLDWSI